jgi:hypothetical protein
MWGRTLCSPRTMGGDKGEHKVHPYKKYTIDDESVEKGLLFLRR